MREVEASLASTQQETPSCGLFEMPMESAHSIEKSTLSRNLLAVYAVVEAKADGGEN
jgi:hypothetical protein